MGVRSLGDALDHVDAFSRDFGAKLVYAQSWIPDHVWRKHQAGSRIAHTEDAIRVGDEALP